MIQPPCGVETKAKEYSIYPISYPQACREAGRRPSVPKVFVDAAAGWNRQVKPRQGCRSAWWRGGAAFILLVAALTGCIPSSDAPPGPNRAADLASLEVTSGGEKVSISPAFNPDVTNYTVQVGGATESIEVKTTVADARATIRINNQITLSGQAQTIALSPGSNTITIAVSAPGADKVYTLVATRGTNANLANLVLSPGGLAEVFDPQVFSYTATVGNQTTSIQVVATAADNSATIRVNGQLVQSGQAATVGGLIVGPNIVTVVVTALDNSTNSYTVTVTRSASSIADLTSLEVTSGAQQLLTNFTPATLSYTTTPVPFSVTSVNVRAVLADTTGALTVNNQVVQSGETIGVGLPTAGGNNTITVVVTAQSGATKTYTVIVPRAAPSNNATLTNLTATPPGGTIAGFSPNVTNYVLNVSNSTTSVAFVATPAPAASVSYIYLGQTTPGNSFTASNLPVGNSVVTIQVVAEAGNSMPYQVTINRSASNNADLSNLEAFAGASASGPNLISGFNSAVTSYTVTIPFTVDQVTVRATKADQNATVSINGQNVSVLTVGGLSVGLNQNVFSIVVTPQSGPAKNYLVSVNRQAASSDNNLSDLDVYQGSSVTPANLRTLTPSFSPGQTNYTASVQNGFSQVHIVAIRPSTATMTIDGQSVSGNSLTVSGLQPLVPRKIDIVVTAQNGSPKTYSVTVTREGSSNANLSNLTFTAGPLVPVFNPNTTNYTVDALNNIANTSVTATAAVGATITINDSAVTSGSPFGPIPLSLGPNPVNIVVRAQDTVTTKSYSVSVVRRLLSGLQVFAGAAAVPPSLPLTPSFPDLSNSHSSSVGSAVSQVTIVVTKDSSATLSINNLSSPTGQATVNLGLADTVTAIPITAQSGSITENYTISITRRTTP